MPIVIGETLQFSEGDTEVGVLDFTGALDSGESVASATVAEVSTSDLTIGNIAVNVAALTVNNKPVAIGKGVQWSVSGQVDGRTYTMRVTATTDSSPARVLVRDVQAECV